MLAAADFFWFQKMPSTAFVFHNIFGLIIGLFLIYLSIIFIKNKLNTRYCNFILFIVGVAMTIIHLVKLLIGKCV